MWTLRAYDTSNDELLVEHGLGTMTLGDLERLLRFAPTKYGSNPLDQLQVSEFAGMIGFRPVPDAAYFLDFDAEPDAVESRRGPRSAATAR